jgi:hypothetical protein
MCFTDWMNLVLFSEEMLPLTGAEMRKYLVEVEKNKNPDGYVSSSPAGVSLRKLKRKESSGKGEAGVIEVDDLESTGVAQNVVAVESPSSKKARTSRGAKGVGGRPPSGKEVGGTSLNDEVMESFWHSEFDIRRYAFSFWLSSSRFSSFF